MRTASSFAVLAGSGITNTGPTTASGSSGADFGSSPTVAFIGNSTVTTSGTKYLATSPSTSSAQTDLGYAYNDALGRIADYPIDANLGNQTLTEGVYKSTGSIGIDGPLILNGLNNSSAVFIFQAGSTLNTASASSIVLINGVQPCNVFWQVGSSATFGASSSFVGHVLAAGSITAGNQATFRGQLLARSGAVTLDTNIITNHGCSPVVTASPTPVADPVVVDPVVTNVVPPVPTGIPPVIPTVIPPVATVIPPVIPPIAGPNNSPPLTPVPPVITAAPPIVKPTTVTATEVGGQLPDTDAPSAKSQLPLAAGISLMALGLAGYLLRRRLR